MTYDERDRREWPGDSDRRGEDAADPSGVPGAPSDADAETLGPADPVPPSPGDPSPTSQDWASTPSSAPDPDETSAWPSTDPTSPAPPSGEPRSSWSTEPPAAGSSAPDAWSIEAPAAGAGAPDAWPTEPPAAGSSAPDAWPTTPPERGGEPILEPEPVSDVPPAADPASSSFATDKPSWTAASATPPDASQTQPVTDAGTDVPPPPPSEVEAYPAAAGTTVAGTAATGAAAHAVPAGESATGESTQCPRCGTENRPGLAFCRNCGQRLVAAGVAPTVERPGTPEGTQACPRCGTHNRAGVAFCQNCGANLRGTAPGYVPPSVVSDEAPVAAEAARGGAVLGPVVLLIGLIGLVTAYLLPFAYGTGSLFERAWGADGYGISFWSGYPEAGGTLADQAYFGLAAPVPLLGLLVLALAIAGFVRAAPGALQRIGLVVALLWSVGLVVLFVVVELLGNWDGDIVGLLRALTPAGIIMFLTGLILLIGTLTRFARS